MAPFKAQLLKWIGNKQRFAHEIVSYFPPNFNVYREPFLGSGAVLGTLAPASAVGSDSFQQLIEIWQTLRQVPETLKGWYSVRWSRIAVDGKQAVYESVKSSYNANPNAADLLFLSRACYGGVVRFRQADGYISTPCGVHDPMAPQAFNERVDEWHRRTSGATFIHQEYEEAMDAAQEGDMIYCDPPYSYSQSILYGAHGFELAHLFEVIARCKARGVFVALSIDGTKKSGETVCDIPIPANLFEREVMVNVGRSMLRRFQRNGDTLEDEVVADRLLLTY